MRAFVTGATGFIGGHVARRLRERGDDVDVLVRSPHKAADLQALGCGVVEGDLSRPDVMRRAMESCDSVFHVAALYKVGVSKSDCEDMHEANVQGTHNVLQAATDAEVAKIVYVSTIGYFGNTRGEVVDETTTRTDLEWLSCYDETKYLAHVVADEYIAQGAPVVIAMPGGVYGPGDTSDLRTFIELARRGWARFQMMPSTGFNFVHIDDVTTGILLVHDKGRVGESYALGGELATVGDLLGNIATLSGHKAPTKELPVWLMKASIPLWMLVAPLLDLPRNLREVIRAGDGVTYWATHDKARRELGYEPRDLKTGLEQTLAAWK